MSNIRARLVAPSRGKLLDVLFETLGVEFVERGGTWTAELFGGTSFALVPHPSLPDRYDFAAATDRTDPQFPRQQKAFGPIEQVPAMLTRVFADNGIECVWIDEVATR